MKMMRRYFFNVQPYVLGIQTGIQAGHAAEETWANAVERYLASESEQDRDRLEHLLKFAREHKTWVILNGGDHNALVDLYEFFCHIDNPYEFAKFHEPGLNNALTSISILLPEKMYDLKAQEIGKALLAGDTLDETGALLYAPTDADKFTVWELEFLKRKAACGLAH